MKKAIKISASLLCVIMLGAMCVVVYDVLTQDFDRTDPVMTECLSNLYLISLSLDYYANENEGWYPPRLQTLVQVEIAEPGILRCPAAQKRLSHRPQSEADEYPSDYVYIGRIARENVTSDMPLVAGRPDAHETGGNVVRGDLKVYRLGETEFMEDYRQIIRSQ